MPRSRAAVSHAVPQPSPWTRETGSSLALAVEVLIHGPLARTELARRLDLSQASLTRLSAPLLASGLLVELDDRVDGRAGRPSRPLDVVPESRHFVGVKLTGDDVVGVVTDLRANVLGSASRDLPDTSPEAVADMVAEVVAELRALVPQVTAVGVGIGGLVRDYTNVVSAPFLHWEDVALGPLLAARTGLPTVIENDVVTLTEAEHWFGSGRDLDRFAVLTIGAGIGYGAVVHGGIVVSDDSGLGLVGHWPLEPDGPSCGEGHRGCAQAMLASPSIVDAVSGGLGRPLTYDQCLNLAEAGDPVARPVVEAAGRALGRLMAAVGNLLVPERIILAGEGVRLAEVAADSVREGIARDRNARAHPLDYVVNDPDATQWCRGAAVIAIQTYVLGAHPAPAA